MYYFSGILIFILLLFFVLGQNKKRCVIRKICSMSMQEKCCKLNALIEPMGYCYHLRQDVFTSRTDAWQREFGYCALYDKTADAMNMVFDCEPVYFDYQGKTWLIEVWKGQYGINIGGEIGVYHADYILPPERRRKALFHSASDDEMLPFSIALFKGNRPVFELEQRHWWLTGFSMGQYCRPEELRMTVTITFPDCCMLQAFADAFLSLGYTPCDLCVCGLTVKFCFNRPCTPRPGKCHGLRFAFALWKDRIFCRLYLWATRPFECSVDRLLYLYGFLPYCFRRTIRIRRFKKHYPYRRHYQRQGRL